MYSYKTVMCFYCPERGLPAGAKLTHLFLITH